jgi:hypothetical protein
MGDMTNYNQSKKIEIPQLNMTGLNFSQTRSTFRGNFVSVKSKRKTDKKSQNDEEEPFQRIYLGDLTENQFKDSSRASIVSGNGNSFFKSRNKRASLPLTKIQQTPKPLVKLN